MTIQKNLVDLPSATNGGLLLLALFAIALPPRWPQGEKRLLVASMDEGQAMVVEGSGAQQQLAPQEVAAVGKVILAGSQDGARSKIRPQGAAACVLSLPKDPVDLWPGSAFAASATIPRTGDC